MKDLVAGGLVQSHIGSKGGFTLAKVASAISIKDVYEDGGAAAGLDGVLGQGRAIIVRFARFVCKNRFGKRRSRCWPIFSRV